MEAERVAIFIDGSNLYYSLKNVLHRTDLDLGKFAELMVGSRYLVRTYYYGASVIREDDPVRYQDQQRFFDALRRIPDFEIRLGRLVRRGGSVIEKGVDVWIAVDMLTMAHKGIYDTAVLVSGDADYVRAVEAVKDTGKHVEIACFRSSRSNNLIQCADRVVELDGRLSGCFLRT